MDANSDGRDDYSEVDNMRIDVAQLEFIDSNLRTILTETEKQTGLEFTITSLYRINDSGVHGALPLRGTDLRMRDQAIGERVEAHINSKWAYDPSRPQHKCALLHGVGSNLHIHVQTHPNTVRR